MSAQLLVGIPSMEQIRRYGLDRELRLLIESPHGVQNAEDLELPLLQRHPAVIAEMPSEGGFQFEAGLRKALSRALAELDRPLAAEVLRWEFAIAEGSADLPARTRTNRGLKKVGTGKDAWRHDGAQDPDTGKLRRRGQRTRALERIVQLLNSASGHSSKLNVHTDREVSSMSPNQRRTDRSIRIGRLEISDAVSIASCDKEQSSAQGVLLEFEKDPRPPRADLVEWPLLEAQLLPTLEDKARQRVVKFENDPIVDLVYVEHQPSTPGGPNRYRIGVAQSSYYLWATTANSLDRDLTDYPDIIKRIGHSTLRDAWSCDPSSLPDLTRLPAPAFIGVCVVVICEGKIMVLERQKDHHVASSADGVPAHFVGEGMLPKDIDAGRFSPEQAARRGCEEELGIGCTHLNLIPTGLIIDTKHWQPLFAFVGECDLTLLQLERCMKNARHGYETGYGKIVAQLPWTVRDEQTLALLTDDDPTLSLASNHAQAALLHALYYADGRDTVDNLLEQQTGLH